VWSDHHRGHLQNKNQRYCYILLQDLCHSCVQLETQNQQEAIMKQSWLLSLMEGKRTNCQATKLILQQNCYRVLHLRGCGTLVHANQNHLVLHCLIAIAAGATEESNPVVWSSNGYKLLPFCRQHSEIFMLWHLLTKFLYGKFSYGRLV
jgi:hypothetical protein